MPQKRHSGDWQRRAKAQQRRQKQAERARAMADALRSAGGEMIRIPQPDGSVIVASSVPLPGLVERADRAAAMKELEAALERMPPGEDIEHLIVAADGRTVDVSTGEVTPAGDRRGDRHHYGGSA